MTGESKKDLKSKFRPHPNQGRAKEVSWSFFKVVKGLDTAVVECVCKFVKNSEKDNKL